MPKSNENPGSGADPRKSRVLESKFAQERQARQDGALGVLRESHQAAEAAAVAAAATRAAILANPELAHEIDSEEPNSESNIMPMESDASANDNTQPESNVVIDTPQESFEQDPATQSDEPAEQNFAEPASEPAEQSQTESNDVTVETSNQPSPFAENPASYQQELEYGDQSYEIDNDTVLREDADDQIAVLNFARPEGSLEELTQDNDGIVPDEAEDTTVETAEDRDISTDKVEEDASVDEAEEATPAQSAEKEDDEESTYSEYYKFALRKIEVLEKQRNDIQARISTIDHEIIKAGSRGDTNLRALAKTRSNLIDALDHVNKAIQSVISIIVA